MDSPLNKGQKLLYTGLAVATVLTTIACAPASGGAQPPARQEQKKDSHGCYKGRRLARKSSPRRPARGSAPADTSWTPSPRAAT